jgi:O-antigen ligase
MNPFRPMQWLAIAFGAILLLYLLYTHQGYLTDATVLGGVVGLEVVIAALWKYDERFFPILVITFVWAGMHVPMESVGTLGRWVLLAAGAGVGFIEWQRAPRAPFRPMHLIALFCICTAFVSATVSPFMQAATLKAASLLLLFLYCSSGLRLAVIGREERFFHVLIFGCELLVYGTAICYFGAGAEVWGNPNSLGAAMSVGAFPILLWGWYAGEGRGLRFRRLVSLLLCAFLVKFSLARAGMAAIILVAIMFFVGLRQYKLLLKGVALVAVVVAVGGVFAPATLSTQIDDLEDAVLYKGHKESGILGSRKEPWDKSIASIKEHPWFGTGYGTSESGNDSDAGTESLRSTAQTEREHGSSYITIVEWEGLFGMWPFAAILALVVANVWRVFLRLRRTGDSRNYSLPIAMVVVAGLVHGSFEDSIFAVGSYLCLYFWIFAFMLADYVPGAVLYPVNSFAQPLAPPGRLGAIAPTR